MTAIEKERERDRFIADVAAIEVSTDLYDNYSTLAVLIRRARALEGKS